MTSSRRAVIGAAAGSALIATNCRGQTVDRRLLSEAPLTVVPAPAPTPTGFKPIRFPEDEAPHGTLVEWWYYVGHLFGAGPPAGDGISGAAPGQPAGETGEQYGFQMVFFRSVRGDRAPGYAAHLAITDPGRRRFRYEERADVALDEPAVPAAGAAGPARPGIVSRAAPGDGFALSLDGWSMSGRLGDDRVLAAMPGYALDLTLRAARPPVLHVGVPPGEPGVIPFGPGGYSYYYSRTRMALSGTLEVDGESRRVTGEAWMDHQWGDFLAVGWGGWDWFAAQLADGRDIALFVARDPAGTSVIQYGTLVEPTGAARQIPPGTFTLDATGTWTSPRTQIRYPSGWRVRVPDAGLDLHWTPLLEDQELDTRPSTGVIYWEGAVRLEDAASGADVGRGYVELTGYTAPK